MARKVVGILGGRELELVHNHHNFAWKEQHDGRELVVVRKGATPAFPGQKGFVGGSMGDDAVIIEGARDGDAALQRAALYSTVHGAGRVMSRTEARGKVHGWGPQGAHRRAGKVSTGRWSRSGSAAKGVILRGGGLDESAAGLSPAAGRARGAGRHDSRAAHAAPAHRRDGGRERVRSVQGLRGVL